MTASPSAPDLASDEPGARVAREPRRPAAPELTRLEPPR